MSTRNQTRKRSNSILKNLNTLPLLNESIPYKCKWNIDNDLLNKFLQCFDIGDKYQSKIFDNLWRLKCYPNGNKSDNSGKTILCIELCSFPTEVTKLKLRIKLSCPELNKIWSTITDFERDRKLSKAWSSSTLFKYELNECQNLSFIAEIFVIEQSYRLYEDNSNGNHSIIIQPKTNNISLDGDYKSVYFQNKDKNKLLKCLIHMLFKKNMEKHDISNFDEKENNVMTFDDICQLIKEYYPINLAIWDITDEMLLNRFIVSKNEDKFDSDIFEIGGFKWYLRLYPKGYNRKNKDYFQCFLSIATLPPSIRNVFVNVRLSCPQTMTSYTFFADYTSKHKTWGWSHNFTVNELHSLFLLNKCKRMTFLCEIKILKVISFPHKNIYELDIPSHIDNGEICKYEWNINKELMSIFRKSPNGKMYESSIFNDMFCIQIYPNGVNKQDIENCQVFCQITAFPKGVNEILAKLELLCPQIGEQTHWQHLVKFSQDGNNWGWESNTITINDLYKYSEITISARIQFIELYDETGLEISKIWKKEKSLSDIEDDQHDEKTPHEHDKSHQLLELANLKLVKGFIKRTNDKNDIDIFNKSLSDLNKVIITTKDGKSKILDISSSDKQQHITDLITKFSMDETHELFDWDISKPLKTVKFTAFDPLKTSLGSRQISDIFRFHNLNWVLQSYLIANNSFYHIMLTLCSIPSVLSQVVISYRLYCNDNMTSTTGVCILCQDNQDSKAKGTGLDTGYLLMKVNDNDDKTDFSDDQMTFTFAINVLTIKDSQYQVIYKNQFDWDRVDDTNFKWIIDTKMISKFENCCKGQKFESENIYDDLWCVGIAPNGINTDDVILYLQLSNKPIDINSITVGCQMNCVQFGIQTKYTEQSMGIRDDEFSKIQFNLMNKTEFMKQIKSIKQLTIECEISIIKMSSENGLSRRSLSHSLSKISSPMAMERRSTRTSRDYSYNNETLV